MSKKLLKEVKYFVIDKDDELSFVSDIGFGNSIVFKSMVDYFELGFLTKKDAVNFMNNIMRTLPSNSNSLYNLKIIKVKVKWIYEDVHE